MAEVLIDTSAWIAFFRGHEPLASQVDATLADGSAAVCGMIELEVLQNVRPGEEDVRSLMRSTLRLRTDEVDYREAGGELLAALEPVLAIIEKLSEQILVMEKHIKVLEKEAYPETNVLRQVTGVGAITALTFVLTLEDPTRFRKSRDVGAFLGLTPGQKQSGDRDVKLRISKRGDEGLRRLLVQSAHYLLGPFGSDCDHRHF